jgi:hypothetical protein
MSDIREHWPIVKNVDGKQLVFMPDGTQIPCIVETTLTQGVQEANQGIGQVVVRLNVQVK